MPKVMKSTRAPLHWSPVPPGTSISVPCEGGFVGEVTREPGVEFWHEGRGRVFVPRSLLNRVLFGMGPRRAR